MKVSTAGFALTAASDDASRAHGSKCKDVGGGVNEYWAVVHGTWKPVIAAQDTPGCAQLKQYSFPSAIAGDTCFGGTKVVAYSHA